MGVDQVDPLPAEQAAEAPGEPPIDPGPPAQHLDTKALVAELPAEGAQLVEADEQEPELAPEPPGQPGREHFGPAHAKPV